MTSGLIVLDAEAVNARLSIAACIPLMRDAMSALSAGRVEQHLRSFLAVGAGRTFALMPAAGEGGFGAKLVSVYEDPEAPGRRRHQGLVVVFDPQTGSPVLVGDAEEITRIRTAAASAAATQALARPEASRFALIGTGAQAEAHLEAMAAVRPLTHVRVWGRNPSRAHDLAKLAETHFGLTAFACETVEQAVREADIICTTTASREPILSGAWVSPGAHVNLVGSSGPGAAEADSDLVASALFIGDHRDHVLAHGGEFRCARDAGRITDGHLAAEIGQVFNGEHPGRTAPSQITVYKSLGHAIQDLAVGVWLLSLERKASHG